MAKLEAFDSQEAVPEALREFYVERDGKWVPDAPDLFTKGQNAIERERRQRLEAMKKAEDASRALQEMQAKVEQLEAAQAAEPADQSKVTEHKIRQLEEKMKAIEANRAAEENLRKAAEQKLADKSISDVLRAAAMEQGVSPEAVEDLVALPRFRQVWRMTEQGEPAPFDGEFVREVDGKPLSAKAYTAEYLKANKHWLAPSNGGGASGSAGRPSRRFSATRQEMKDPVFYSKMKEETAKAGLSITDVIIVDT